MFKSDSKFIYGAYESPDPERPLIPCRWNSGGWFLEDEESTMLDLVYEDVQNDKEAA